jgi:hypothetical protein
MEADKRPKRPAPHIPDLSHEPLGIQRKTENNKENLLKSAEDDNTVPEKKRVKLSQPPPKPPRIGVPTIRVPSEKPSRDVRTAVLDKQAKQLKALQERIDHECLYRDGTVKLLQATTNSKQALEASKSLFVCNSKIIALMNELQKLKSQSPEMAITGDSKPCQAKIAVSDIRIPLEWQEFESQRGKTDPSATFHIFCLFKLGHEVMDTSSIVEITRDSRDVVFDSLVQFSDTVGPDFHLEVEVYCAVPCEDDNITHKPATPVKSVFKRIWKDHSDSPSSGGISSSLSSTAVSYVPSLQSGCPTHRFAIAGHAGLTLEDLHMPSNSYPLKKGAVGSSGTAATCGRDDGPLLPLWTSFNCNLMAQPKCAEGPRITGFVNVQQLVSGLPNWVRLWGIMRQNHLRCWTFPEDVGRKMPIHSITFTETMTVENASRLDIRRPNALVLRDKDHESFIAFESKEERSEWFETIQQAIVDYKFWKTSSDFIIPDKPGMKKPVPSVPTIPQPPQSQPIIPGPVQKPTVEQGVLHPPPRTTSKQAPPSRPPPLAKRASKVTNAKKTPLTLTLEPMEPSSVVTGKESLL